MSWLDPFLDGIATIQWNGVPYPQRATVNFVGGVTVSDDPANLRTVVTVGSGLNIRTSTAASVQVLQRAANQIQIVDMSGGPFTQPLPASPLLGDLLAFLDPATSLTGGVYANPCMLSSAAVPIQDAQLRTTALTYLFGYSPGTSSQWSGGSYAPFIYTGVFWKYIG